jgi:hypothetical protein
MNKGSNSQADRIRRYIEVAQGCGLTVHAIELLKGRGIRIITAPPADLTADNDEAEIAQYLAGKRAR